MVGGGFVDGVVLVALLVSFATLVSVHLAIAVRMVWRVRPRYRGLVALIVVPLAPLWAYEQRWRRMSATWVTALGIYLVARVVAAL